MPTLKILPSAILTPALLDQIVLWQMDPIFTPLSPDAQVLLDAILDCGIKLPNPKCYDITTDITDIPITVDSMAHRWVVAELLREGKAMMRRGAYIRTCYMDMQNWVRNPTPENKERVGGFVDTALDNVDVYVSDYEPATARDAASELCGCIVDIVISGMDFDDDPPLSQMLHFHAMTAMLRALYHTPQDDRFYKASMVIQRIIILCALDEHLPEEGLAG